MEVQQNMHGHNNKIETKLHAIKYNKEEEKSNNTTHTANMYGILQLPIMLLLIFSAMLCMLLYVAFGYRLSGE